jgi:hypothetical protein
MHGHHLPMEVFTPAEKFSIKVDGASVDLPK